MSKFTHSFATSLKVAELIQTLLPESILFSKRFPTLKVEEDKLTKSYYYIGAYQNGREQGVTISVAGEITFYVCIYRNSDQIGYWKGHYSMEGLDEAAWNAGFNGFSTPSECAEAIANEIKTLLGI